MRVQIPAYTDHWMRGDRFGEVVKVVKSPAPNIRAALLARKHVNGTREIAAVRMDKSGKTIRVILDDCTVID